MHWLYDIRKSGRLVGRRWYVLIASSFVHGLGKATTKYKTGYEVGRSFSHSSFTGFIKRKGHSELSSGECAIEGLSGRVLRANVIR